MNSIGHKKIVELSLLNLKVFHDLYIQISKAHDVLVSVYSFTLDIPELWNFEVQS